MTDILTPAELNEVPKLPKDSVGPVFDEPWQARAFAMTLELYEKKVFTWGEWCKALSSVITAAEVSGADPEDGSTYYQHWLKALEGIVTDKNVASGETLRSAKADWRAADDNRGFGEAPDFVKGAGEHSHSLLKQWGNSA